MSIRSPIISVLGHVDHGKSSILDRIRNSSVTKNEAGGITQAIGASIMPQKTLIERCGDLLKSAGMTVTVPGVLFIDTPGHAAFTSLRKRGGSLADIAVVVVDINDGFMPQTIEAIEILKQSKTPFVIAANKVDKIGDFGTEKTNFLPSFQKQNDSVKASLEGKVYELVGSLHEKFSYNSERFDRVSDYTKEIAIIPCSAISGVGMKELLMVLTGLSQKYLERNLGYDIKGPGKGVVLEVKDTTGFGKTLDVILYDGHLSVGDNLVVGSLDGPHVSKVKALMLPNPLADMRDKKSKYKSVKKIEAAIGVKVCLTHHSDSIISGMPLRQFLSNDKEDVLASISKEIGELDFKTENKGVIVKADTLGSLEACVTLLREKNIPIRKAGIGEINKKDINDAESTLELDPLHSVILGFNIKEPDVVTQANIIVKDVIYALIDDLVDWQSKKKSEIEVSKLEHITRPVEIEVLQNCIFRQSNPCIAGVEVIRGILKSGCALMKSNGDRLTILKGMQLKNENVATARKGDQVAVVLPSVTAGRQLDEGNFLYSDVSEDEFKILKKLKAHLEPEEKEVLKKIVEIKRKNNSLWGV